MAATRVPELHADPVAAVAQGLARDPRRRPRRGRRHRRAARGGPRTRACSHCGRSSSRHCRCCSWSRPASGATSARWRPPTRRRACSASRKALNPPAWLKEYGYVIAITLFVTSSSCASSAWTTAAPFSALLLLGAMTGGFVGRHVSEGQERLVLDDVPAAARPAGLRPDAARAGRQQPLPAVRRLREELLRLQPARRLPGRPARRRRLLERLPALLRRRLPGPGARLLRDRRGRLASPADAPLHGAEHGAVRARDDVREGLRAHGDVHALRRDRVRASSTGSSRLATCEPLTWPLRAAAIALAATWLVRTWRKEQPFLDAGGGAAPRRRSAPRRARSPATARSAAGAPEVTFVPEDKRVAAKPGLSLLEIAESNGMAIESGCRMGICGADPVADQGRDGVPVAASPTTSGRRSSASASAPNTRMACCARMWNPAAGHRSR